MSESLAVFLRGINVGGIQIRMEALRAAFTYLGFSRVQTILASGNVIATPPPGSADLPALKAVIERELGERFHYDAHVLLRTPAAIDAVLRAAEALTVANDAHLYVLLCDDPALPGELQALYETLPHLPGEQFWQAAGEALWSVPKGSTLGSDFGNKVLGSKKYKPRLTSRNVQTIEKVYNLLSLGQP